MLYIPIDKPISIRGSLGRQTSLTRNGEINAYTGTSIRRTSTGKGHSQHSLRKILNSESARRKISTTSAMNKSPPKTGCDNYSSNQQLVRYDDNDIFNGCISKS